MVVATFIVLIGVGAYIYLSSNSKDSTNSGEKREFTFKASQDEIFHIKAFPNHILVEELKGKILFLKVFGWDCEYCQKEIPELIKLKNKFSEAFDTIAIEYQHHLKSENLKFIKKYGINYHVVEGDKNIDFLNYLKHEYNWNGVIPLTVVIGADGRILAFEVGYKSYSLTTLLQTTLKEITTEATNKTNQGD
jgi:thiol-disulfide isomerase/thioredoxin